ncbi:MAG: hypothetical protein ACC635_04165 [Acidiferrobacterales bacterium]
MYIHTVKIFRQAALVLISVAVFTPIATASDAPENFQVVNGVAVYLGVMPAQVIEGRHQTRSETKMHKKKALKKEHRDHVVVALFDNATGKRIENAKVKASVMEFGLGTKKKKLDPMKIAGTITYGSYFDMPSKDIYHIEIEIRRPGIKGVIKAKFTHKHFVKK